MGSLLGNSWGNWGLHGDSPVYDPAFHPRTACLKRFLDHALCVSEIEPAPVSVGRLGMNRG